MKDCTPTLDDRSNLSWGEGENLRTRYGAEVFVKTGLNCLRLDSRMGLLSNEAKGQESYEILPRFHPRVRGEDWTEYA